jgi:anti-anti-sigma regulatory factor
MEIAVMQNMDADDLALALRNAADKLDGTGCEVLLDFVSIRRIDPSALRAMEDLAVLADQKAVKLVLRNVDVSVYKVLKLVKLARRFSFVTSNDHRQTADLEKCHAESSAK